MDSGSFTNVTEAKTLTPGLCREFFTCAVDNGNCTEFERVARLIVDECVHRSYDSRACLTFFSIIILIVDEGTHRPLNNSFLNSVLFI